MATGIRGKLKLNGTSGNTNGMPFRLEYEGKLSVEEIFNVSPAQLNCVISVEKNPRNRPIYGDNLRVLRNLLNDANVAGQVRLIYIDPPYATGCGFESRKQSHAYHDLINGADDLEFLPQRLVLLREGKEFRTRNTKFRLRTAY
jgi:adenine-specific DNA-methyltransferase